MSLVIKFYRGCMFHDGRETFGRFRRKSDAIWDDLCKQCFLNARGSRDFLEVFELREGVADELGK